MNAIRQTQQLNKRELENATPPSASWHADYRDTAWVYVGGIPLDLSEGDIVIIFSQFGNPTHLNLIRDRETGKSKGFGFLKYGDQRSCDLAVDNLTGADILGRMLRVDHTRYKKKDDEDEDTWRIERLEAEQFGGNGNGNGTEKRASDTEESDDERRRRKKSRPMLKEERELEQMLAIKENGEEEDPMKNYLIQEKKDEVKRAREREDRKDRKHRHERLDRGDAGKDKERGHRRSNEEYPEDRGNDRAEKRKRRSHRERSESVDSDGDVIKRSIEVNDRPDERMEIRKRGRDGKGERSTRHRRDSPSSERDSARPDSRDKERRRHRKSRSRSEDRSQEQRSSKRRYG